MLLQGEREGVKYAMGNVHFGRSLMTLTKFGNQNGLVMPRLCE